MQKLAITLLAIVGFNTQTFADGHTQAEINAQIWLPFIQSYAEGDGDLHASLYSKDIVRVNRGNVQTGEAYIERMRDYVNSLRERGGRPIAFRFTERSTNGETAYETGVFRLMRNDGTGMYGQFEVLMRKEEGRWKLTFDHDQPTDRAAWDAAEPMDPVLIPTDR